MKKDTFYFSHDANAKDDPKCMALIDDLGMEGYGIFWVLIEMLRSQPDYKCPMSIIKSIARQYNTTAPKVEVVVKNYGLFEIENNEFFFSQSLLKRMEIVDKKRNLLSEAGKKGNAKRWINSQDLSPGDNHPIATKSLLNKIKENKIKEKIYVYPSLDEFILYAKSVKDNIDTEQVKLKYLAWAGADWVNGNGKKIKNWKSTLCNTIPFLKTTEVKQKTKEL